MGPRNGIDFKVRRVLNGGDLDTEFVPGFLTHDMSGMLTFNPDVPLDYDATYQVDFLSDAANQIGFRDGAGNYIEPYSFRFSTGSGLDGQAPPIIDSIVASDYQPLPGQVFDVTTDAEGIDLEYRFNFGDGWSDWTQSAIATYAYAEPGRYRVIGQVRDSVGTVAASSVRLLVIEPPSGPSPTHSNTMTMADFQGSRAVWMVNPDADTVSMFNPTTGSRRGEISVGERPQSVAAAADGSVWVTCEGEDAIYILNSAGTILEVLELGYGSAPWGIAPTPDGQQMFVTLYGSAQLVRFDVANPSVAVSTATFPTPRSIAVTASGDTVLVTRLISTDTKAEVGVFASSMDALVWVDTIDILSSDAKDGGDRAAGVPNYLGGIAIAPDGKHALVTAKQDNIFRGEIFGVSDLSHENTMRAVVCVLDLDALEEVQLINGISQSRRDFDNSANPMGITFSPAGDLAMFALQGNNRLVGFDTLDLAAQVDLSAQVSIDAGTGLAPSGVLFDADTGRLFASNFTGRSLSVFNASSVLEENQSSLSLISVTKSVSNESLTAEELLGKQIFYNASDPRMSAEGYISCASCHLDGGHDGRVWDFTGRGEGLRRTTDLRGRGGMAHGNVHWSGNFDEIQDFEHDIRDAFGGEGFIVDADFATNHPGPSSAKVGLSPELDALAAYTASLKEASIPMSPFRAVDGTFTEEAVLGAELFRSLNCASCHAGSAYTDSAISPVSSVLLHDVGTTNTLLSGQRLGLGALDGVDTPTLMGLHASQFFLHHGVANNLGDALAFATGKVYPES